ncbi:TPR domain protein [Polaribacter dokdonensis DSW-5]|uniref:Protein involved in gliding motility SprE n=1 Tax=Polaribacter dokdonensis DSW-5 TaxID=1300348 RepID=A0A0N1IY55_9FLAO|nr:TPR domain protein [Polaribacter dokdonensis DSW-5]SEE04552.1 protein involved in gliding motility SprE [Polaribacter dokdonensis DSW-5]
MFTFIAVIASCSTKKDSVISRNYHALTTKYNILFNGNNAFDKGIDEINNSYTDDWFLQLPLEPIEFEEDKIIAPTFNNNIGSGFNNDKDKKPTTTFERAEEKAVKAIQKHGMNIDGIERNRQIDNAYLLLGKARYYQQRFIPAVEAFNYVIANYPNADLIAETKIWRAKTNIRLDNEETAIESMKLLLVIRDTLEADLPNRIKEQAHTALAMAYVKSDSLQNAKKHLQLATRTLENQAQGARNLFVLGQIYSLEDKKDSANLTYNRLANFKKAPYKYKIHANIELARNTTNDSISVVVLNTLQELIKDRENRPYLDELYYQTAVLQEKNDSIQLAKNNYYNSLRAANAGDKQKTFTYENLGNLAFKEAEYQNASAYYDSVLQFTKDTLNLRIRRIKRKYKNLASLIKFEDVVQTNDSIVRIATLTKEEQTTFFENYIEKIKEADEAAAQLRLNQMAFANPISGLQPAKKGEWYFYNSQSLSFGKSEFFKIWGNRRLEDNWRWSEKASIGIATKDSTAVNKVNIKYDLDTYLSTIPKEQSEIDSLIITRNEALYELGLIYKEQFKNLDLAKQRLERVNDLNEDEALVLPINWHLYQLYTSLDNETEAEQYKNVILTKYSETKFAQVILNPNVVFSDEVEVNEVERKYKELYYLYKDDKFNEVITQIDAFLPSIPNAALLPKFELLKALAIGKFKTKKEYKAALDYIVVSYGNTEEAEKAKAIVAQLK